MKGIKEISYGIIPFTYRENYWEIFIIQHLSGNHWGFPKGHPEKGESPKQAAERELQEETSMEIIRYLGTSYFTEKYQYKREDRLIDKTVILYPAETTTSYSLLPEEIIQGKWIPLQKLFSYATFENQKTFYSKITQAFQSI